MPPLQLLQDIFRNESIVVREDGLRAGTWFDCLTPILGIESVPNYSGIGVGGADTQGQMLISGGHRERLAIGKMHSTKAAGI